MTEVKVLLPLMTKEQLKYHREEFEKNWLAERGLDRDRLHERQSIEMWKAWYDFYAKNEPEFPQTDFRDTEFYCRFCGKQTIVVDVNEDNYDYDSGAPEECLSCSIPYYFTPK